MKIKVKLQHPLLLPHIIEKGDWIDLRTNESVIFKAPQAGVQRQQNNEKVRDVSFDYKLIPLGIAMQLPKGFEAVVAPRSSTFKKLGILQANSLGIIDNSYNGNDDYWQFPAIALRATTIDEGTRICQFRIQLSQKATFWQKLRWLFSSKIEIVQVDSLSAANRSGFGSTGVN